MLYKKYHRSYIRQFKKETKFEWINYREEIIRDTVKIEPYITDHYEVRITGDTGVWELITSIGQLDDKINIV